MNPENPNHIGPENEHSPDDWESLIDRAQRAYDRILQEPDQLTSYSRISRNLINPATPDTLRMFIGDDGAYQDALDSLNQLEKYFNLIDSNPNFAAAEKASPNGMFPDIYESGTTDSMVVVDEIEKRLKQTNE